MRLFILRRGAKSCKMNLMKEGNRIA
jgi:hypothetical protein